MSKQSFATVIANLVTLIISFLVIFLGLELVVRYLGYQPWQGLGDMPLIEPGGRLIARHPALGYTYIPGEFRVTQPDGYSFKMTHLANTLRITHPLDTYTLASTKPEIWIFGCSFTYGWSLNDEETYPWLLQQQLPEYEVVNFGVGGYSTIQSFLQFQAALAERPKPRLVVLTYASFHDQRNTRLRIWRKQITNWNLILPFATLNQQGGVNYGMAENTFYEFFLMRYSALSHWAEITYNNLEYRNSRSHELTQAVITDFVEVAQAHGVLLVIAGIFSDSLTTETLNYFRAAGIQTVDISVDLSRLENINLPHDNHPSALANRQYAQNLLTFLKEDELLK